VETKHRNGHLQPREVSVARPYSGRLEHRSPNNRVKAMTSSAMPAHVWQQIRDLSALATKAASVSRRSRNRVASMSFRR
jgi:hypothetical protein